MNRDPKIDSIGHYWLGQRKRPPPVDGKQAHNRTLNENLFIYSFAANQADLKACPSADVTGGPKNTLA
jgi:hypothetical protein